MGWYEQAVEWAHKYMKILGTKAPVPVIKLTDNLGSKWLGITNWTSQTPGNTTIRYQKSIIDDPRTFERVAAHEMVHHHEFMNLTAKDIALMRAGVKTDGHGKQFFDLATKINDVMGKDFVTKTSDSEYVLAQTVKKYFLYVEPTRTGLVYGWAVRLSPKAQKALARRIPFNKGRLYEVNDRRWTRCEGKIGSTISLCRADGDKLKALEQIYDTEQAITDDDDARAPELQHPRSHQGRGAAPFAAGEEPSPAAWARDSRGRREGRERRGEAFQRDRIVEARRRKVEAA
jgi:hypothetical protein